MNIKRFFLPLIFRLYRYLGGRIPDIDHVIIIENNNKKGGEPCIVINGGSCVLGHIYIKKIDNPNLYNHIYDLIKDNSLNH